MNNRKKKDYLTIAILSFIVVFGIIIIITGSDFAPEAKTEANLRHRIEHEDSILYFWFKAQPLSEKITTPLDTLNASIKLIRDQRNEVLESMPLGEIFSQNENPSRKMDEVNRLDDEIESEQAQAPELIAISVSDLGKYYSFNREVFSFFVVRSLNKEILEALHSRYIWYYNKTVPRLWYLFRIGAVIVSFIAALFLSAKLR